eukprot:COSAG06_NODE_11256_length_1537_cov_24.361613_1_plen_351_part_10
MQIFVRMLGGSGRKYNIEVERDHTVESLRRQLADREGDAAQLHLQKQLVLTEGVVELVDGETLEAYPTLGTEAELTLALRLPPRVLRIDVGGTTFTVHLRTLLVVPDSTLAQMFEPVGQGGAPLALRRGGRGGGGGGGALPEGVPHELAEELPQREGGVWVLADRDSLSFRFIVDWLQSREPAAAAADAETPAQRRARERTARLEELVVAAPMAEWSEAMAAEWAELIEQPAAVAAAFRASEIDGEELMHLRLKPLKTMLQQHQLRGEAATETAERVLELRAEVLARADAEPEPEPDDDDDDAAAAAAEEQNSIVLPDSTADTQLLAQEAEYFGLRELAAACRERLRREHA